MRQKGGRGGKVSAGGNKSSEGQRGGQRGRGRGRAPPGGRPSTAPRGRARQARARPETDVSLDVFEAEDRLTLEERHADRFDDVSDRDDEMPRQVFSKYILSN